MKHILLILGLTFAIQLMGSNGITFEKKEYINGGDTLLYRVLYPEGYDESKLYPLVVFLHGAGERGSDNEKQLAHGSFLFLKKENRIQFPAIVIFPQCPERESWFSMNREKTKDGKRSFTFTLPDEAPQSSQMVNDLVDELISQKKVNTQQLYILGLSMGGMGTLEHLARWGDKYAAAICICGGHNPDFCIHYPNIPIWFTHGGVDDVVPPHLSMDIYSALCKRKSNKDLRYTLFEEANHNSWDATFAQPDILEWLFKYKKQ